MRYPRSFSMSVLMIVFFTIYLILLFINEKIKIPNSIEDINLIKIFSIYLFGEPDHKKTKNKSNQLSKDLAKEKKNKDPSIIQIDIIDNTYVIENEDGLHPIDHLQVPIGQKIRWLNNEAEYHTVTHLQERLFNSGNLKQLDTFEYTFDMPGRYWIHCREHPKTLIYIDVLDNNPLTKSCRKGQYLQKLPPYHFQVEKGVKNI